MGYDSNFNLHFYGGSKKEREEVAADIEKVSGYTFNEKSDEYACLNEAHWYDCDKDILKVTKKHPEVIVEVWREGEERDDDVAARYHNGDVEVIEMQHTWPSFTKILIPGEEKDEENPFGIPDLNPMYERVRDYIQEKQGEKGYIITDNSDCDTIWALVYCDAEYQALEYEVKAVRVNEDGKIEIIYDNHQTSYKTAEDIEASKDDWCDVKNDDCVYYIPTIFNIAECIREYVESDV